MVGADAGGGVVVDIKKLACFCLVYETRSFAQAAEELFFSRQAVGKMRKNANIINIRTFILLRRRMPSIRWRSI